MRKKLSPVAISAILCSILLVVAAVAVMASRSGGGDRAAAATQAVQAVKPASSGSTGEVLPCPGGGQAETFFSQVGSEFRIVGRLASVDPDQQQLLVKGPQRYVKLAIAPDAKIETALAGGQIVKASGNFNASGDAQATSVQPACSAPAAVAQVTAAPTPFPFPPEPTIAPTPIPVVAKTSPNSEQARQVTQAITPTPKKTPKPKATPKPKPAKGPLKVDKHDKPKKHDDH